MKTKHNIFAIGILGIAIAIVVVVIGGVSWHRASAPVTQLNMVQNDQFATTTATAAASSTLAAKVYTPHPPHGSVTYQVAQAATQLPGFVQATIDPADVSVGQVQHFIIVTSDPNPVTSVVAMITTDHKTITVPLVSQGTPAVSLLVPRTVAVGKDGVLALVDPNKTSANVAAANTEQGSHIANAATADETEFTGQWKVEDTHTARYQTVFVAKDSAGNTNSVTLQWTDPCPIFESTNNFGGTNAIVSGSCTMPGFGNVLDISLVDGPEQGNLVLASGTLSMVSGVVLVINNSYSIKFSGGSLTIPIGAQIDLNTEMCGTDYDSDKYIAGSSWTPVAGTDCTGTGMVTRTNFPTSDAFGDCNDLDPNVKPGQTAYFSTPTVTNNGGGPYDYNCDGVETESLPNYGQISDYGGCVQNGCVTPVITPGWFGTIPWCGIAGNVVSVITDPDQCHGVPGVCQEAAATSTPMIQSCH